LQKLFSEMKLSQMLSRPILTLTAEEPILPLMKRLSSVGYQSAVIVDPRTQQALGFVDALDVMSGVLNHLKDYTYSQKGIDVETANAQGNSFFNKTCNEFINRSQRDPMVSLTAQNTLLDAVKVLQDVHRLMVKDDSGRAVNILTQTDILSFIMSRYDLVTSLGKTIKESGINPTDVVGSLGEDTPVIGAMRYMRDCGVSGVAVTNPVGQIVTNFSSADLLRLTPDKFTLIASTLRNYLQEVHGFIKPPICCKNTDTVETVMLKLERYNIHRVYIVDDNMIPTGFLSITDIMRYLTKE